MTSIEVAAGQAPSISRHGEQLTAASTTTSLLRATLHVPGQLLFTFQLVLLEAFGVRVLVEARVHWGGRESGEGVAQTHRINRTRPRVQGLHVRDGPTKFGWG